MGIAAMGATQHHYLGVDRQLREVLAWFGALVVPVGSYLSSADFVDGAPSTDAAAELDALLADTVRLAAGAAGRRRCGRWRPAGREADSALLRRVRGGRPEVVDLVRVGLRLP